ARADLAWRAQLAARTFSDAGLEVSSPDGGVVSVTAPGPEQAVAWAAACAAQGIAVGCFRPPSTPDTRSRLRLTINTGERREDFVHALAVIVKEAP
ncbi:MAG: aminotransferase class I/II-fold pyridoxal phosphate-dependent enzyme, partial [Micromonosporaceae bacterium]